MSQRRTEEILRVKPEASNVAVLATPLRLVPSFLWRAFHVDEINLPLRAIHVGHLLPFGRV
jgi:hypothetical protein